MKHDVPATAKVTPLSEDRIAELCQILHMFFQARGSAKEAEDLAQITMLRVLQKAAEVLIENLPAYVLGIAKNVLSESRRERLTLPLQLHEPQLLRRAQPIDSRSNEGPVRCLEKCMKRCISREERDFISAYYSYESGAQKILQHRRLAEKAGITENHLAVKAHRIRKKLKACFDKECAQQ